MTHRIATSRPLKIIKVFTDVGWWVGIVGSVILTVAVLGSLLGAPFSVDPVVKIEVESRTADQWAFAAPIPGDPVAPRLSEVHGVLELRGAPRNLRLVANALLIASLAAVMYAVHLFRSLLKTVVAQEIFTDGNAARLSKLGWWLITIGIAISVSDRWLAWAVLNHVRPAEFVLSPASGSGGSCFLIGILTLVLAEIWRHGVELQRDRDSTV